MKTLSYRHGRLIAVTSLLSLGACASGPETATKTLDVRTGTEPVAARIVEDTAKLSSTSNGIAFRVTAVIRNSSDRTVFKGGRCEPDAQLQVGDKWESVFSPICAGPSPVQRIEPGDSLVVPVVIYGFTSTGMEPYFDRQKAHGTFRIVFAFSFDEPHGATPQFTELPSSNFVVVDPAIKF